MRRATSPQPNGQIGVDELPPAVKRVAEAAHSRDLAITIRLMPATTRTAEDAAAACGCAVGQIVKSLIFKGKESSPAILLLVSGANRVNEDALAARLGEAIVRPDADFVRAVTGFAIGGIPPFAHTTPLVSFFDADLLQYETVWAAAGTPHAVFAVDPGRLFAATGATVINMT